MTKWLTQKARFHSKVIDSTNGYFKSTKASGTGSDRGCGTEKASALMSFLSVEGPGYLAKK